MPGPCPQGVPANWSGAGPWVLGCFKAPRSPSGSARSENRHSEELTEWKEIKECAFQSLLGLSSQGIDCWCHVLNGESLGRIDLGRESKAFVLAKLCLRYM